MNYVLVKFNFDYADEFDLNGFYVTTSEEFTSDMEYLKINFKPNIEKYFGTNESIIIESIKEIENAYSITSITEEEYNTLKKLFGKSYSKHISYGKVWGPSEFIED